MRPFPHGELASFLSRGVDDIVSRDEVNQILKSTKPVIVKYGIDPTTAQLHLGYWVIFRRLKKLQALGHTVVVVLGTFTGRFGDPTGKTKARTLREKREVEGVARSLSIMVKKILAPSRTKITQNARWLDAMSLDTFFHLLSHFTVGQMRERDLFQKREHAGKEVYLYEFLYPILQAYDSVAINADLTIVGSDQLFNELQARKLQHSLGRKAQGIITLKLLPGTDGKEKMSQSLGNAINVFDSAEEQFGALMSIPDAAVPIYAELLSDFELAPLVRASAKGGIAARDAKMRVAETVVAEIHGTHDAARAKERFVGRFRKHEVTSHPSAKMGAHTIVDVLVEIKMASSKNEARRLLKQRGVKINGNIITDERHAVSHQDVIAVGKRRTVKVIRKTG